MMDIEIIFKGLVIGVIIAAPIGPSGLLCVQRIITIGRLYGIFTGVGAGLVDTFWALIGLYGVRFFSDFVNKYKLILSFLSAIFLGYLGIKNLVKKLSLKDIQEEKRKYHKAMFSGALSTALNPLLLGVFIALFASLNINELVNNVYKASYFLFFIFIGSISWWFILGIIYSIFKYKMHKDIINWINIISGICLILLSFGIIIRELI